MANSDTNKNPANGNVQEPGRRDFIVVATYAMAGLGAAAVAWPLIDQLNPAADTLALANIEVDIFKNRCRPVDHCEMARQAGVYTASYC